MALGLGLEGSRADILNVGQMWSFLSLDLGGAGLQEKKQSIWGVGRQELWIWSVGL